jgi:hypothetical protein
VRDAPLQGLLSQPCDLALPDSRDTPPALSTSTREILDAGLAEATAAFPAPPRCQPELLDSEATAAFPAPRRHQHELPHQRLARQQEAAACLAVLTPLPLSPTLSQEEHDEALALRLALGTSPLLSITTPHTRHISLVSWIHRGEASTTVVQDIASWAVTWPTIHLTDLSPFLLSPVHSRLDTYYDFFNFRMGQWVAIPQAYAFDVATDEPVLLRCVGMVTEDEDNVIGHRVLCTLHQPQPLPRATPRRHQPQVPPCDDPHKLCDTDEQATGQKAQDQERAH